MGWEVEEGFRIGNSRVHPWLIHINVLQNQYSIVKQNEVKIKIKKKRITRQILKIKFLEYAKELKKICPKN